MKSGPSPGGPVRLRDRSHEEQQGHAGKPRCCVVRSCRSAEALVGTGRAGRGREERSRLRESHDNINLLPVARQPQRKLLGVNTVTKGSQQGAGAQGSGGRWGHFTSSVASAGSPGLKPRQPTLRAVHFNATGPSPRPLCPFPSGP